MPREWKVCHLFAGLGGGGLGFARAGFRTVGAFDSDPAACRDFERLVGHPATTADLAEMSPDELADACDERPDVVFASPPCLPASGVVITQRGDRPISEVRPGDNVWTHRGRWRRVSVVNRRMYRGDIVRIRLAGSLEWHEFTPEHPIWHTRVRRGTKRRYTTAPAFCPAGDLKKLDRVGFPAEDEISGTARKWVESFGDPSRIERGGRGEGRYAKPRHIANLSRTVDLRPQAESDDLWFLLGVYVADGYRMHGRYEVNLCVGHVDGEEATSVRSSLRAVGLNWGEDRSGGDQNVKIRVCGRHFHMLCGGFGDLAHRKRLPEQLHYLERRHVLRLWEGWRWDGHRRDKDGLSPVWRVPTTSHRLADQFKRLLLRTGMYASVRKCWDAQPQSIEGREVQTMDRWELSVWTDTKRRPMAEFVDGVLWTRIAQIERRQTTEEVWNLEVEEDDTFCCPFVATHNCKGFSGCLPTSRSRTEPYQAMNSLALRGVWLALEAWTTPPPLILLENVPRIQSRGAVFLDQIEGLLRSYGYAVTRSTHDCGELGGLAQRRRRFLLVARHMDQVPPFLFVPPTQRVRGIGEVLGELPVPLPGGPAGGPLHRLPRLSAMNWVRLALIPAGGDWRELPGEVRLPSRDGRQNGGFGVNDWTDPAHTVVAEGSVRNTWASVADPRLGCEPRSGVMGVQAGDEPSDAVIGHARADNGPFSVADPRVTCRRREGSMGVTAWDRPSTTVIAHGIVQNGPWQVADPRLNLGENAHTGLYGVAGWAQASHAIRAHATIRNSPVAIADPRVPELVGPPVDVEDRRPTHLVIRATDGTWHRPMTTLELAALQGFPARHGEAWLELDGRSHQAYRERIGNAVPPPAAEAIARSCAETLTAADGPGFLLSSSGIWVEPRREGAHAD